MTQEQGGGRRVRVIGAGFSGLVSAYYLLRAGFQVEVIEKEARVGGLINTLETPLGLVETAANGLLNSRSVEELFEDLELDLVPTLRAARRRYIFASGKPRRWPFSFLGTLAVCKFIFLYFFWRQALEPKVSESVADWGRRCLGENVTRYGVEAALQGIYAGNAKEMSASLIFGRLLFGKSRSQAPLGARGTVSAARGMGQLVEKLREVLEQRGVQFQLQSEAFLKREPQTPVVLAVSSASASQALAKIDPERSALLSRIELLPVVSSTVFFREPVENGRGFGCLFPPSEKRKALGVLMPTFIFPGRVHGAAAETWIMGGAQDRTSASKSDQEILDTITKERKACFGAQSDRLDHRIIRWPAALPHYTTELEKILPQLQKPSMNVFLMGNYLGEIGLAKILERAQRLPKRVSELGQWSEGDKSK